MVILFSFMENILSLGNIQNIQVVNTSWTCIFEEMAGCPLSITGNGIDVIE